MKATYPAWGIRVNRHWTWVEHDDKEYQVHYEVCPAEPDVGINSHYIEILEVKPQVSSDIEEQLADQLWEMNYDDRGNEP